MANQHSQAAEVSAQISSEPSCFKSRSVISLAELFWIFFKIGSVAFGGFMALIGVIESIIVDRRKLLSHEDMLDGISLANLLPGPQAVNCVAYVGYRLRGGLGALVCAVGVLTPTFILMTTLTWLYMSYGSGSDALKNLFAGFTPAVAAVIVAVVWRMGSQQIKGIRELSLSIGGALTLWLLPSTMSNIFGGDSRQFTLYSTLSIILGYALIGLAFFRDEVGERPQREPLPLTRLLLTLLLLSIPPCLFLFADLSLNPTGFAQVGLTFSGLSMILFGGGYVFIPMIQDVVVGVSQWLSVEEFNMGIALSQVTPGPIMISAGFIGQKVITENYNAWLGVLGGLIGTISIFAPPAILMVTAAHFLDHIKGSILAQAAMRGIRLGVIGMIFVSSLVILRSSLPQGEGEITLTEYLFTHWTALWPTVLIFGGALLAQVKWRLDVVWVIPAAGVLGVILY